MHELSQGQFATIICVVAVMFVACVSHLIPGLVRAQRIDILEPRTLVGLFCILCYVVRPLFLVSPWGVYAYQNRYDAISRLNLSFESFLLGECYALAGVLCFQAGYALQTPLKLEVRKYVWNVRAASWTSLTISVLACASIFFIINTMRDYGSVSEQFGRGRSVMVGYGYVTVFADVIPVAIAFGGINAAMMGGRHWAGVAIPMILAHIYYSMQGGRVGIPLCWLTALITVTHTRRVRISAGYAIGGAIAAAILLQSLGYVRNRTASEANTLTDLVLSYWTLDVRQLISFSLLEFSVNDMFAFVLDGGLSKFPLLWGESYLGVIAQMIPRAMWPDKPETVEIGIGREVWGHATGNPVGMIGELYMNFHFPGILIGMLVLGNMCNHFYRASKNAVHSAVLFSFTMPIIAFGFSRSVAGVGPALLVMYVAYRLALPVVLLRQPQ